MLVRWLIKAIDARNRAVSATLQRVARRAMLTALSIVVWLTVVGFALAAFTVWLSSILGVTAACGVVASVLAALGLCLRLALARSRGITRP